MHWKASSSSPRRHKNRISKSNNSSRRWTQRKQLWPRGIPATIGSSTRSTLLMSSWSLTMPLLKRKSRTSSNWITSRRWSPCQRYRLFCPISQLEDTSQSIKGELTNTEDLPTCRVSEGIPFDRIFASHYHFIISFGKLRGLLANSLLDPLNQSLMLKVFLSSSFGCWPTEWRHWPPFGPGVWLHEGADRCYDLI